MLGVPMCTLFFVSIFLQKSRSNDVFSLCESLCTPSPMKKSPASSQLNGQFKDHCMTIVRGTQSSSIRWLGSKFGGLNACFWWFNRSFGCLNPYVYLHVWILFDKSSEVLVLDATIVWWLNPCYWTSTPIWIAVGLSWRLSYGLFLPVPPVVPCNAYGVAQPRCSLGILFFWRVGTLLNSLRTHFVGHWVCPAGLQVDVCSNISEMIGVYWGGSINGCATNIRNKAVSKSIVGFPIVP